MAGPAWPGAPPPPGSSTAAKEVHKRTADCRLEGGQSRRRILKRLRLFQLCGRFAFPVERAPLTASLTPSQPNSNPDPPACVLLLTGITLPVTGTELRHFWVHTRVRHGGSSFELRLISPNRPALLSKLTGEPLHTAVHAMIEIAVTHSGKGHCRTVVAC